MALEHELQVFRAHLEELLGEGDAHEGWWTIVKGDVVAGVWPTYEEALTAGYGRFGLDGFLCKQVERFERVHFFNYPI